MSFSQSTLQNNATFFLKIHTCNCKFTSILNMWYFVQRATIYTNIQKSFSEATDQGRNDTSSTIHVYDLGKLIFDAVLILGFKIH